jgi:hypothetical protein
VTDDSLYADLLGAISAIRAVDSHSHLCPEAEHFARPLDALSLYESYAPDDLMALGCPPEERARLVDAAAGTIAERWAALAPYWPKLRNTAYARLWVRTVQGLLGAPSLDPAGLELASARLRELMQPGEYRELLRGRCALETSLLDRDFVWGTGATLAETDGDLFRPVVRTEEFLNAGNRPALERLEARFELPLRTLEDLAQAQDGFLEDSKRRGAVALKFGIAYQRTLRVEDASRAEAEACFGRLTASGGEGIGLAEAQPLQDWLIHRSLQRVQELDLTVVFHTGLQFGGKNFVANSDPTLLTSLFLQYPGVHFDLFHAGYPYVRECGVLAKYFPNVWADLAWAHFISQPGTQAGLLDWLDLVPAGKIIGFGADLGDVEMVWAAQEMARENLALVLAERVRRGYDTEEQAVDLARVMLRDAPADCYRLELR